MLQRMLGLALEAGGVKGFSHIATIKLFNICNTKPDIISGSSFGSIVGTLYALYEDADEIYQMLSDNIEDFLKENSKQKINSFEMIIKESLFTLDEYYRFFKKLYGKKKFSDLRIPTIVVAFDLESMNSIILDEGFLVDAVLASCTVPGVFEPTYLSGSKLLDGGVLSPLPTNELKKYGAKRIVASIFEERKISYINKMELMVYLDSLKGDKILEDELTLADFVFSYPVKVDWSEFHKYRDVYKSALDIALKRRDEFEDFIRR
ncbi:MAG: patatin-like phospholipase family protein [Fervidobacterium sp.]